MGSSSFQVRLTESALNDLHEIDEYWFRRQEPERGEQYVCNLIDTAEQEISQPVRARSGRLVRVAVLPETREILVFKGSYRIIYRIEEELQLVEVLRFWHGHRDEPGRDGE